MVKYIFVLMLFAGCSSVKQYPEISLKDEVNKSIIDGFGNDTTNVGYNFYLLN
jgi:hypothetical protein